MSMQRFEFLLQADTPVAHHSETLGNSAIAMRQRIRQPDGKLTQVPIITGDTMRHGLREASARLMLSILGIDGGLSEGALQLLFAGGMIRGASGSVVDLAEYHRVAGLMPQLALLGGCAGNRMIPGKTQVDPAILVCRETAHITPDWATDGEAMGARGHVEEVQRVRMDPTLNPSSRALLSTNSADAVQQRLLASESADDAAEKEKSKSSMLPRRFETIVAGSRFWWRITARPSSDLETDALLSMIGAFLAHCQVGGKRGTGHGRLSCVKARQVNVMPITETAQTLSLVDASQRAGKIYASHVREHSKEIKEFLDSVVA